MEIIRKAVRVGNSAGVLLPREFLDRKVKVILQPLDIEREILEILIDEKIINNVLGVYLVGSFARNEETIESDVDILVITDNLNKRIEKGKYSILCIEKKEIEKQLKENALPVLAMLKEAKTIINKELVKNYLFSKLNEKNLEYHLRTTKSAMRVVEKDIANAKEEKNKVSDASAYSLILRLRTIYIINCIRKNKIWSKKEFLKLARKISGSEKAYERYLMSKNKNSLEYELPIEEAEKLKDYIIKKIKEIEKWARGRKELKC